MSLKVNLASIQLDKKVGGKVISRGTSDICIKLNDTGVTVTLDVLEITGSDDIPVGSDVAIAPDGSITVVTVKVKPVDTTTKRKSGCTLAERQAAKAGL